MKQLFALCLVALFAVPAFAQDATVAEKKSKSPWHVIRVKKMLKDLSLTPEQEDGFKKAATTFKTLANDLKENGLTKEMRVAREKKRKEGRTSGIKGKELITHINDGLSQEQIEMFGKLEKGLASFEMTVAKMITEDQLAELPEKVKKRVMQMAKGKKGGSGKKKKMKKDKTDE